jgi:hypothetical protein
MIMSVTSSKSLDELDQDFRKAVQRHKFGRLERARSEADARQQGHRS